MACGLAEAGLERGQHLVVVGENRPRLYAAMLAAQALGAIPVPLYQDAAATEYVFPIRNADVAFADRRGPGAGRQDDRGARRLPAGRRASGTTTRGDCVTTTSPASRRSTPWSPPAGAWDEKHPGFFEAEVEKATAADVAALFFTSGTTGNPKGVVHTHETLIDRARGRRPLRQAHRRRRSARLPAARLDRPEHLLLRAVAGLRLRRQLPGVGRHGDDRPEGDRPDLLLRAAARLRGPAHQRHDPHGRRRPARSAGCSTVRWRSRAGSGRT